MSSSVKVKDGKTVTVPPCDKEVEIHIVWVERRKCYRLIFPDWLNCKIDDTSKVDTTAGKSVESG